MSGPAAASRQPLDRAGIEREVRALGEWFHNLRLGGVETAPRHFLGDYPTIKWERFRHALPSDLRGRTVLDIGCNAGFYSLEAKRMGAERVLGIDSDERYLAQARFAASVAGLDVEYRALSVYELPRLRERFDVVFFMGVLYHLRHPLLALDIVHDHAVGELLVFQSMLRGPETVMAVADDYPFTDRTPFEQPGYPAMYFVEGKYTGDVTNWWIPNRAGVEGMLRSAGFRLVAHPEEEVFICEPADGFVRRQDEELTWLKP